MRAHVLCVFRNMHNMTVLYDIGRSHIYTYKRENCGQLFTGVGSLPLGNDGEHNMRARKQPHVNMYIHCFW